MVRQHYRWDFIGLSTDTKPTPETNEKVVDGSTFYCSDTSKLYVFCKDTWYEKKPLGGGGGGSYTAGNGIDIVDNTISVDTSEVQEKLTAGSNVSISDENVISATDTTYSNFTGTDGVDAGTAGLVPAPATTDAGKFLKADGTWDSASGGGPTVVQSIGSSTTSVMSQDATTQMVYQSGTYKNSHIVMGHGATKGSNAGCQIVMGVDASTTSDAGFPVSIGGYSRATGSFDVALGGRSVTSSRQEVSVGGTTQVPTRFITNVTNPTQAQDAATKNYVDTKILISDTAPTTSTVGILGQLYTDTSTMHTYQCTDTTGGVYTWTQRW